MENFVFDIKTKAYFGKDQIANLKEILPKYGKKVLLVYGGGSIKKNGIYDRILALVSEANLELTEFGGVESNPTLKTAKKGIELAKAEKIDSILAVGGGSAIDCGKAIAVGVKYDGDVWDFYCGKAMANAALPIVGIATIAASGTDMSPFSVLTNEETCEKFGMYGDYARLDVAILDPTYTYSVNKYHTAAGIADAMSHVMEGYFANGNNEYLQSRMSEAILKTLIEFGPKLLANPEDYEARAQVLWASSVAINGILGMGVKMGFYECHTMGQALSAKYDITHGVSLALVHPKWYEYCRKNGKIERFAEFGRNVWNLSGSDDVVAEQAIQELSKFYHDVLKIPRTLTEAHYSIDKYELKAIAEQIAATSHSELWFTPITAEGIEELFSSIC